MMETINDFLSSYGIIIFGAFTLIEVAPIKVNPWSALCKWIGERTSGDIRKDLQTLKSDFEETKANDMRWFILDFANSCRNSRKHDEEEWNHVIEQIKYYETYVEEKNIDNGVMEETAKYLRKLYHERLETNSFDFKE